MINWTLAALVLILMIFTVLLFFDPFQNDNLECKGGPISAECVTQPDPKNVTPRVKKIIVEHLVISERMITPCARICVELKADLLDKKELIMAFEEEFRCEISDSNAEKFLTVQDIVKFLNFGEGCG